MNGEPVAAGADLIEVSGEFCDGLSPCGLSGDEDVLCVQSRPDASVSLVAQLVSLGSVFAAPV